jgi:hypothetical protein
MPAPVELASAALAVRPWTDPVIDALGHDPRSRYVEQFWLPVLGPTATLLLRRLADGLERAPEGFELPLADTARALGLGIRGGRNSPFVRAIHRCCQFGAGRLVVDATFEVRRRLAPLSRVQVQRLTPELQDAHRRFQEEQLHASGPVVVDKARRLAASLLELGEDPGEAVAQLERWRFANEVATSAVAWALARRSAEPPEPGQEPLDAA